MTEAPPESGEHLREELVSRTEIHRGRLLHVVDDVVRLSGGTISHRQVVEHPGAVAIVAIDSDGRTVLVRQWRHPAQRALWEIPAGTRDVEGESPEQTARRELVEETGFSAASWRALTSGFLAPGYSTEEMHFFLATGLVAGTPSTDDDERMDVAHFTLPEVMDKIRAGEVDVKTIAGLALAGWRMCVDG